MYGMGSRTWLNICVEGVPEKLVLQFFFSWTALKKLEVGRVNFETLIQEVEVVFISSNFID